ncbi:transcription/translation regulatory transformer protein RfaH [Gallaecimonas xiamenensis]|uniref:Transcriptional activator RfaH n=1 Tax=Gallaecimonas xiamenensis 3-C-1 TaxID=745411 RepID=K2KDI8_9GAMM|nr:transcription/translation regulatory transformer protein RfaH [Gallaecimonas xiamenensis]EKE75375.1 transcriptional activator RfaH [Gallaecimonas xiamenensis 3-C-1]
MSDWYLVYCRAKQEGRAKANLQNQGFESYLPKVLGSRLCRGKLKTQEQVLFPNYLFVQLDATGADFYKVRSTRGVSGFVRFGDMPVKIPAKLIKTLALNEERLEAAGVMDQGFKPGQRVRLLNGPFKGLSAIYQAQDGEERVKVMIEILQRQSNVSVALRDLERQ